MTFEEQMDQVQQNYQDATEQTMQAELDRLKEAGLTDEEAGNMVGMKYLKWLKKLETHQG